MYLINGVLLERKKDVSEVLSEAGNIYKVPTKTIQVKMSFEDNKPVKDHDGRYFIRFDFHRATYVRNKFGEKSPRY
jgi:hypothetical protein